ncbi:MAG: hypothetical protein HN597_14970 [Desulfobacula sp.]|jgi:hypothetical protein|uniref:hypothetical protein n=1 Tax=Desulfobacula sp. TaxID=2593537 RepID=UPI0039B89C5B|nr:hypothetical protein [Desulfobacula sp.]
MEVSEINEGSMIECKKHKAIIPPSTCVARHKGLAKAKKSNNGWIKANALNYEDCRGCKIGLKLYEKYLKGEKIMKEKVCSKCHTPKPADKKHFYGDKNSKDGLHVWCKDCHNKSSGKTPKNSEKNCEKITVVEVPPDTKPEEIKPIVEKAPVVKPEPVIQTKIILDFADHMEVLEALIKDAGVNLRAPGKQALWILINALEG